MPSPLFPRRRYRDLEDRAKGRFRMHGRLAILRAMARTENTISELTAWLNSEARLIGDTEALDLAIVERLHEAGLPITRYSTGVPSLHPQVDSFSTLWEQGKGLTFRQFRVDPDNRRELSASPIFIAYDTGRTTRCRLDGTPEDGEYEVVGDLRRQGLTDYLVIALPFSDGSHKAMSFATDRAGGFTDDHVAILEGLRHALATTIEVRYLRHLAGTLMDTYVGPVAGRRVLEGAIRRGSGETISAVIWFCDLKGFTSLSESLPNQVLIDMLNAYFDAVTQAIEAEGGEILKFIGDAVLAIFQPGDGDEAAAAACALKAANAAMERLATTNAERSASSAPVIECGIALHIGDVLYGNVGGAHRLDFTVIGRAVNLASRIESLTRDLARPVLVSDAFAAAHGGAFEDLGTFELKGIAGTRQVLAPR